MLEYPPPAERHPYNPNDIDIGFETLSDRQAGRSCLIGDTRFPYKNPEANAEMRERNRERQQADTTPAGVDTRTTRLRGERRGGRRV